MAVVTLYYLSSGNPGGFPPYLILGVCSATGWQLARRGHWRWVNRLPPWLFFFLGANASFSVGFTTTQIAFYIIAFILSGLLVNKIEMILMACAAVIMHTGASLIMFEESLASLAPGIILLTTQFSGVILLQLIYVHIAENVFYQSLTDALTHSFNRGYFDATLAILDRGRNFPVGILVADLDGLKKVNDSLGHAAGDRLMIRAAGCLRAACRADDALCRIGGDEFAIIFPRMDENALQAVCCRVNSQIEANNERETEARLSLSIGTAVSHLPGTLQDTFEQADTRMYADKQRKKALLPARLPFL